MKTHWPSSLILLALLSACTTQPPANALRYSRPDHATQPEAASGNTSKPGWTFTRQAVAAANPLATDAGHQVLRAGGSALDAAIAVAGEGAPRAAEGMAMGGAVERPDAP